MLDRDIAFDRLGARAVEDQRIAEEKVVQDRFSCVSATRPLHNKEEYNPRTRTGGKAAWLAAAKTRLALSKRCARVRVEL
jgi:hypothetical protein